MGPSLSNKVNLDGSSANDNPGSRVISTPPTNQPLQVPMPMRRVPPLF